jgi:hypothetical protein
MSKIQRQVIFHVKKSSQNFSLDYGLNRIGFFRYRHYNLRDNFLRLCSKNRKYIKTQLCVPLHYKFKLSGILSFALRTYSSFFIRYIPRYFKKSFYKLYDVNTYSYIYFLNRLYLYLDRFLFNFSFFNKHGFVNLNVFFIFMQILYPGLSNKSLLYKLFIHSFKNNVYFENLLDKLNSTFLKFNGNSLNSSNVFYKVLNSVGFLTQKNILKTNFLSTLSTKSYSKKKTNFETFQIFQQHRLFNKVNLADNSLFLLSNSR